MMEKRKQQIARNKPSSGTTKPKASLPPPPPPPASVNVNPVVNPVANLTGPPTSTKRQNSQTTTALTTDRILSTSPRKSYDPEVVQAYMTKKKKERSKIFKEKSLQNKRHQQVIKERLDKLEEYRRQQRLLNPHDETGPAIQVIQPEEGTLMEKDKIPPNSFEEKSGNAASNVSVTDAKDLGERRPQSAASYITAIEPDLMEVIVL
jgi:hypothetical protein